MKLYMSVLIALAAMCLAQVEAKRGAWPPYHQAKPHGKPTREQIRAGTDIVTSVENHNFPGKKAAKSIDLSQPISAEIVGRAPRFNGAQNNRGWKGMKDHKKMFRDLGKKGTGWMSGMSDELKDKIKSWKLKMKTVRQGMNRAEQAHMKTLFKFATNSRDHVANTTNTTQLGLDFVTWAEDKLGFSDPAVRRLEEWYVNKATEGGIVDMVLEKVNLKKHHADHMKKQDQAGQKWGRMHVDRGQPGQAGQKWGRMHADGGHPNVMSHQMETLNKIIMMAEEAGLLIKGDDDGKNVCTRLNLCM